MILYTGYPFDDSSNAYLETCFTYMMWCGKWWYDKISNIYEIDVKWCDVRKSDEI